MNERLTEVCEYEVLAEGLRFPEGPVVLADGSIAIVEIEAGRLTRVDRDGTTETIANLGGGPNGAALGPDGALYVTNNGGFGWWEADGQLTCLGTASDDYAGGSIQRVDVATGEFETLYTHCDGQPLVGPNDLVFDSHGGFYFTDLGKVIDGAYAFGGLFYAQPDGSAITRLAFWQIWPNGIGLSPDESELYVATTISGWLTRWTVDGPGIISASTGGVMAGDVIAKARGRQSFDSLAVEASGTVCAATLAAPGGDEAGILAVGPDGSTVLHLIDDHSTTNICFGGDDLSTAYITSSGKGRLLMAEWPRPGLSLNYGVAASA